MSIIRAEHVTVKFGGVTALNDVDMTLKEGQILALIGPNGAGKTTLFNVLTGFQPATEGRIFFRDEEITGMPAFHIAGRGMIRTFQKTMVFHSVSVEYGVIAATHRKATFNMFSAILRTKKFREEEARHKARAEEILKFVGLYERRDILGRNLAYGEQRLLEIALALAAEPDVLLLDEPAAGLNTEESNELIKLIYQIRDSGVTVLLVEHNMSIVMDIADNIVVLNQGNKIAEGLPEEIKQNPEVIKAYLGGAQHA